MKKYTQLFFGILACTLLSACDNPLDLNDPQSINNELALSSDQNVKLVLVGAYDALSNGDLFGGNVLRNAELLAANGEIRFTGTFPEPDEIFAKETGTSNANVSNFWYRSYRTINIANNVLGALAVVNEEDRDEVEGEALFLRGLSYFELVKLFAKPYSFGSPSERDAVPIVLTATNGLDERTTAERNTVAEVYAQIIDDLTRSASLLVTSENQASRATKESALAVLSRVYLQIGDYAKARDAADAVISSNKNYALNGSIADAFNGGTTNEDVFNIAISLVDGVNNMQLFYAAKTFDGRAEIEITQKHLDLYEVDDERLDLFYVDGTTGVTRTGKWVNKYGNVKIIRLAEMYLTRAEANNRLGTTVGATPADDVNRIRTRVGLTPLDVVTLDNILNERRLELVHEGQRLHDVKRLKETITEGGTEYTYDNNFLVFPVPQRERNVNKNLSQNDGYTNN